MPRELRSKEEFEKLLDSAEEVRVVRLEDSVKLKVRGRHQLYTFKTTDEEAESLLKGVKAEIVEI